MEKVWKCPSVRQGKMMNLDARVERWEKQFVGGYRFAADDPLEDDDECLIRALIADWKRLKADNARLAHIFMLQALDDVE